MALCLQKAGAKTLVNCPFVMSQGVRIGKSFFSYPLRRLCQLVQHVESTAKHRGFWVFLFFVFFTGGCKQRANRAVFLLFLAWLLSVLGCCAGRVIWKRLGCRTSLDGCLFFFYDGNLTCSYKSRVFSVQEPLPRQNLHHCH